MKSIIKKIFITYLVVICCIYTPTAQAAGWSFGGFNFGNNSLNIVKDGVKITTAAVDTAPITGSLAKRIASGAARGVAGIALSMAIGIALDSVEWVMSDDNTSVKWRRKDATSQLTDGFTMSGSGCGGYFATSPAAVCDAVAKYNTQNGKYTFHSNSSYGYCTNEMGGSISISPVKCDFTDTDWHSIPVSTIAQKIYDMAKSGNATAQADVAAAVADAVSSGAYDTPINKAIADAAANTNNPANPNDNTNTDNTKPKDIPALDTSSITAAISSMAAMLSAQIQNLAAEMQGIKSVINTSIDKLLNKQDELKGQVVNVGSKVDSIGGKVEGLNDNVKDIGGKVVGVGDAVKDVGGKVVGLNDSVDKVGDKVVGVGDKVSGVGDKVTGVGDKVDAVGDKVGDKVSAVGDKVTGVGADVRGVGDKITGVGDRVSAVGDKVTAVGDKVTASNDKVADKVDAAAEKITNAIKEKDKDKPESKPFELPAFCSWATKVCDFIDWVKQEPDIQDTDIPTIDKTLKNPAEFDKDYVSVAAQCPADVVRDIPLPGRSFSLVFAMSPVCDFASTYLRPVIIFLAYIYGALSIANAFRVGG